MKRATLVVLLAAIIPVHTAWSQQGAVVEYTTKGSFDEIKQLLVIAIENQGLVVDHQSDVGRMLDRTAKDVGAARRVYEQAEVLQFCSATYSRDMVEADPRLLGYCPYGIAVYTLPGESGIVHVVYRRVRGEGVSEAATAALKRVDELLNEIAQEATQ
jgi:uncharacterized protein (DUF302 family)